MSQEYDDLKRLLKQLFQLDRPELDFGLYRIMHAKSAEVTKFLDEDLLPQVKEAFEIYKSADRTELQSELQKAIEKAEDLGVDPEETDKVKFLRSRLENEAVDIDRLEGEVFDHLYRFFRRYYLEGDFLSKRVYKEGVYAIPYEGEEVKLHWANADQYYTKTGEYLRNYAFRLRPHDPENPLPVHFQLVDAEEGEHGNIKDSHDRVFVLAPDAEDGPGSMSVERAVEGAVLTIRFEYRPATMEDWPPEKRKEERERLKNPKPPKQSDLDAIATERILGSPDDAFSEWISELARPHVLADGSEADFTRLEAQLRRYNAKNTFDYFIHKDLGGFLRRELDFYIKNEVMHLDDIESESAPRVEQYLSKIKVIRRIAGKLIDFLAQLENFQKKLWLKKKFVVETSWCIRVGCVPEDFYDEIAANEAQRQEWVELHRIDELHEMQRQLTAAEYTMPLSKEFLAAHPTLTVDSRHYSENFTARLLEAMGDLDDATNGVVLHSENFQALALIGTRYEGRFRCVYLDPPYNSKTSEIAYKNSYKHSSWLSLMNDRLRQSRRMVSNDGSHVVAIDENEQERLGGLLEGLFPDHERVCVTVVHNKKGIQGRYFSYNHEFAYFCLPPGLEEVHGTPVPEEEWEYDNLRAWGRESERTTAKNCFYPILVKDDSIIGFGEVSHDEFHPESANIDCGDHIKVYPVDKEGVERKWRYARDSVESILPLLKVHTVARTGEIQIRKAKAVKPAKTVWDDSRYIAGDYGTKWLTELNLKIDEDLYPKSIHTVADSLRAVSADRSPILDYFAGSGTTGHAVIKLNREDGGDRKFVLVEMGEYFDSVLLPRLKKVTFSPEWKDGKPQRLATREEAERSPQIMKVVRLESYEDTLNNLDIRRTETQQDLLDHPDAQGPDRLHEEYLLRYMLDIESQGSSSLLDIDAFSDPTTFGLKVKRAGSDETRETTVDLLETFNWLIGLRVKRLVAPRSFTVAVRRNDDRRLQLDGDLEEDPDGPHWLRYVTGTLPDDRRALVVWRKLTDDIEQDNLVLNEWFSREFLDGDEVDFDVVYVNGSSNLENLRSGNQVWTVRIIEADFHRRMFEDTVG